MTTPLFKKLNHKEQNVFIINSPDEFNPELEAMKKSGNKITAVTNAGTSKIKKLDFVLSFVKTKEEIERICSAIEGKLTEDAIVWFAYPKGTSKKYKAEINRDSGWESIKKKGFDTVRAIAIDDDWSALRFRQVEFIKVMTRKTGFPIASEGKLKAKEK
jgi:hypothetical protein